jgi:hypothetical protein
LEAEDDVKSYLKVLHPVEPSDLRARFESMPDEAIDLLQGFLKFLARDRLSSRSLTASLRACVPYVLK